MKWLKRFFGSPQKTKGVPEEFSDDIPTEPHQEEVHRSAREYLKCFVDDKNAREKWEARFESDPLFGLEVLDEAAVLAKNEPGVWRLSQIRMGELGQLWKRRYDQVVEIRGGRVRHSTTPTLRGGGKRGDVACDFCNRKITRKRAVFSSDEIQRFVAQGLTPDEGCIADAMKHHRVTRAEAIGMWRENVVVPATGLWQFCGECANRIKPFATGKS